MINKIEFSVKNLTSNAGLFLLLEHAKKNGVFDLIENDLIFDSAFTHKIKKLNGFRHNQYLSEVKMLAKFYSM